MYLGTIDESIRMVNKENKIKNLLAKETGVKVRLRDVAERPYHVGSWTLPTSGSSSLFSTMMADMADADNPNKFYVMDNLGFGIMEKAGENYIKRYIVAFDTAYAGRLIFEPPKEEHVKGRVFNDDGELMADYMMREFMKTDNLYLPAFTDMYFRNVRDIMLK